MAAIDPKTDPEGAYRWALARLGELRDRELELEALFAALGQQVTWGVVRCKDVINYNNQATLLFNASVDFFTWFKPAANEIQRQTGISVFPMQEVPLPQLIGTRYLVIERGGGHKEFDAGVVCDVAGNFPPGQRDQLQLGPTPSVSQCLSGAVMNSSLALVSAPQVWSPYPTLTDLRQGGLGIALPAKGGGWAQVAIAALTVIGLIVVYKIVQRVLSTLDGTRALELENASQAQVIAGDLARAECVNQNFQALNGPGITDQAAREALFQKVTEICKGVVPQRDPNKAHWWTGVTGVLLVGGLVAVGVIVAKGRNQRSSRSDDE